MKPKQILSTAQAIRELYPLLWANDKGFTICFAEAIGLIDSYEKRILLAFITALP